MVRKGLTLIELMVAMTIFIIVMTISIGGFVSISKARATIGIMKDTQQKVRIANEMIIRYAKESQYISFPSGGTDNDVELYFNIKDTTNISAVKFEAQASGEKDLLIYKCTMTPVVTPCVTWGSPTSLLGGMGKGIYLNNSAVFQMHDIAPAVLEVDLDVSNDMHVQNSVVLEGLK